MAFKELRALVQAGISCENRQERVLQVMTDESINLRGTSDASTKPHPATLGTPSCLQDDVAGDSTWAHVPNFQRRYETQQGKRQTESCIAQPTIRISSSWKWYSGTSRL